MALYIKQMKIFSDCNVLPDNTGHETWEENFQIKQLIKYVSNSGINMLTKLSKSCLLMNEFAHEWRMFPKILIILFKFYR